MNQPAPPPPPSSQPSGPPPGHYRASDGRDYPIPAGYYLASDGQLYPTAAATTTPAGTPPTAPGAAATAGWRWDAASIALVAGVAVVAVGAFLPWVQVSLPAVFDGLIDAPRSKSGIDGDGTITLGLAVAAAILGAVGIVKASKGMIIGSIVAAVLIVLVAIIDMADVASGVDDFDLGIEVSIGIGLYLTFIGGVVAAIGAILALRSRP